MDANCGECIWISVTAAIQQHEIMAVMLYLGYENINFTYYHAVQYCFRPDKMYFVCI